MPQKTTPKPWAVHHRMTDCVTFEGRHGQENLFLQNLDGYFACQNPEDAALVLASPELLVIAQRLVQWDLDYPVNCYNGYAGLEALNKIIADAKAAIAKATQPLNPA
jgi:hypothetical protein